MGLIDIHTHLLPCFDDGPQSSTEAAAMLEAAWAGGTREIVATPHMFHSHLGSDDREEVEALFAGWRSELLEEMERPRPAIHLGAENYVSSEFAEALAVKRVLTLAGSRYLLIEFWPMILAGAARNAIATIQEAGYVPVLAHVERYGFLQDEPGLLEQLIEGGVVAQVNAGAILGRQGLRIARLADRWLRRGWVAVVASDGHSVTFRPPDLGEVASYLESRFGGETAELCLTRNPSALLADGSPTLPPPASERRWWKRRV